MRTTAICLMLAAAGAAVPALANTDALSVYATSSGTQWATTGTPASSDTWQSVLGFLQSSASPTTEPLYECLNNGLDRFLNLGNCNGYSEIDLEGYIFDQAPDDQASTALYRCNVVGSYHYASTASDCGGNVVDGPLGAVALSAPLELYADGTGASPSWATTGPAPGGSFTLSGTLGYLVSSSEPGTVPLYQCLNSSNDHFISIDDCEGQPILGVEGALFGSPPTGPASVPIYRCSYTGSYHFASNSASCDGENTDGLMGYALQQPLPIPAPPTTTPTTTTPTTTTAPASTAPATTAVSGSVPARRGSRLRPLRLHIVLTWTWNLGTTRLRRIDIHRRPRGTRLTLRCAGRDCPYSSLSGGVRTIIRRVGAFHPDDRVSLTIRVPHRRPLRIRIRIRYAALPLARKA